MLTSFLVEKISLPRYRNRSTNFRGCYNNEILVTVYFGLLPMSFFLTHHSSMNSGSGSRLAGRGPLIEEYTSVQLNDLMERISGGFAIFSNDRKNICGIV